MDVVLQRRSEAHTRSAIDHEQSADFHPAVSEPLDTLDDEANASRFASSSDNAVNVLCANGSSPRFRSTEVKALARRLLGDRRLNRQVHS